MLSKVVFAIACMSAIVCFVLWIHERGRHRATLAQFAALAHRASSALAKRGVPTRKIAENLLPEALRKPLKLRAKQKKEQAPLK